MPPNGEQFRYSYVWFSIQPEHGFHQGFHHSAARLCSPKCFITSLAPLPTGMQCERAEAAGPADSGTRCPLQPATKPRLRGTAWGGTWATLQWKKCPQESCGVLQAVAVLEDTARGQSACLESASSCYIPTKVPEQHFSCSSLFLFLCAFPQKVCYAHRQPRASEQVGWCWTRGPQSGEDSAERKGRSSRAEVQTGEGGLGQALPPLLHQEMLLHGVSSLFPAAFSTLSTMASSSAMAPNLPMAVTRWGRRPGPRSVLESCLPTHSVPWRTRPALMWLTSFAAQDCFFLQWQARVYSISHCRALWSWKIYKCYNHFYYHLYTTFNVSTMWLTHKIHF